MTFEIGLNGEYWLQLIHSQLVKCENINKPLQVRWWFFVTKEEEEEEECIILGYRIEPLIWLIDWLIFGA